MKFIGLGWVPWPGARLSLNEAWWSWYGVPLYPVKGFHESRRRVMEGID